MRIHEGHFAYDLEPFYDPRTFVAAGWRYRIYAMHPERRLAAGEAKSREEAEAKAQSHLAKLQAEEAAEQAA